MKKFSPAPIVSLSASVPAGVVPSRGGPFESTIGKIFVPLSRTVPFASQVVTVAPAVGESAAAKAKKTAKIGGFTSTTEKVPRLEPAGASQGSTRSSGLLEPDERSAILRCPLQRRKARLTMVEEESGNAPEESRTPLPKLEDLHVAQEGFDREQVAHAFDVFRRRMQELDAEIGALRNPDQPEPTGHAVRMDALHLIRAAAEFADQLERDAQNASLGQLRRTQEEVKRRQRDVNAKTEELERYRQESETRRAEILNAARAEAREVVAKANEDASRSLQEAEAKGARLLEQARQQANELTSGARAEVEQTLGWARAEATAIIGRAQEGAEELLSVAGLGSKQKESVVQAIIRSARAAEGPRPAPAAVPEQAPPEGVEAPTVAETPDATTEDAPVEGPPPEPPPEEPTKTSLEDAIRPTRRLRPRVRR